MTDSSEHIDVAVPRGVAAELRYLLDLIADMP